MAKTEKLKGSTIEFASPAFTPEDREDQLIAMAMDLAEQRMRDGTASNQLITEFIRRGSTKERLEREKLKQENEMLQAKIESIRDQDRAGENYERVLQALRDYGASVGYSEDDEYGYDDF